MKNSLSLNYTFQSREGAPCNVTWSEQILNGSCKERLRAFAFGSASEYLYCEHFDLNQIRICPGWSLEEQNIQPCLEYLVRPADIYFWIRCFLSLLLTSTRPRGHDVDKRLPHHSISSPPIEFKRCRTFSPSESTISSVRMQLQSQKNKLKKIVTILKWSVLCKI